MTMDAITLIERLEAVTQGSADLDGEIGRDVVGLTFHEWPDWIEVKSRMHDFPALAPCPNYTSSIDCALTLIDPSAAFGMTREDDGTFSAWIRPGPDQRGATPALALCIAALKARGVK